MIAASTKTERWLIYALGGGAGHLTRAVSLARAAIKVSPTLEINILTNSSFASSTKQISDPRIRATVLDPKAVSTEISESVVRIIGDGIFDTLVVDTFPRGLAGELALVLPQLRCRRVLVHRPLCPEYANRQAVRESIDLYDLILAPGESGAFADHPRALRTKPWLIRDAAEIHTVHQARAQLAAQADRPVLVVAASGKQQEIDELEAFAVNLGQRLRGRASVFFASAGTPTNRRTDGVSYLNYSPLIEIMPGVDLLLAAGGYNTVHEARATKTPLLAIGQRRLYDRQTERLLPHERVKSLHEMMNAATERVTCWTTPRTSLASYTNGVHKAVGAILAIQSAHTGGNSTEPMRLL